MGLLDDVEPLYTPPPERKYRKQTALNQDQRDYELNNFDRKDVTEDFGDSPFADRV